VVVTFISCEEVFGCVMTLGGRFAGGSQGWVWRVVGSAAWVRRVAGRAGGK